MTMTNPDVLYIPKISRVGMLGAQTQLQYGFLAMTPGWLFFIPQLTQKQDRKSLTSTRFGDFFGKEFFAIVPKASEELGTLELEKMLLEMSEDIEAADKVPISEVQKFKVGFLSFSAATAERSFKVNIGISFGIKKEIRAYLAGRGLTS